MAEDYVDGGVIGLVVTDRHLLRLAEELLLSAENINKLLVELVDEERNHG